MTLDQILADFEMNVTPAGTGIQRQSVTIWLDPEYKERYDRLQRNSRREFSKKAKAALMALINLADKPA